MRVRIFEFSRGKKGDREISRCYRGREEGRRREGRGDG